MKISANWLRSLTRVDAPAAEIAERLTRAGVAVDAIRTAGEGLDRVVVGVVRSARPHADREKLTIVEVEDGQSVRQVVCGAANVPAAGGRVALAIEGATIGSVTVARRKFAGVDSDGMLCSEAELGIGPDASGILVIDDDKLPAGKPLAAALSLIDHVLELDLTPNRGDCLGHVGVAREVSALYAQPFSLPEPEGPQRATARRLEDTVKVSVEDVERCPRYAAAAVTGLQVKPSPFWVRYRLFTLGIRPISNLVDVTNLILLEFGQPLHAFDLDRLAGPKIVVRRARAGEMMKTLDGVPRALIEDDLLICDAAEPVALAGIMGGAGSEIVGTTTNVLIECAHFEPRGILRTARRLGLHTDSSHRFERGVDPNAIPTALAQAASLMTWLGGGAALPGLIDVYPRPIEPRRVRLRPARLDALLGMHVDAGESQTILERLGCRVTPAGGELDVDVPTSRPDISREVDLVEEVARVRGYDAIPTRYPAIRTEQPRPRTYAFRQRARHTLAALGLDEAVSFAFVSPRDLVAFRLPSSALALQNPLSEERSIMRTSLVPGLCQAVGRARRVREDRVRLFEVGRVFAGWSDPIMTQAMEPHTATPAREELWAGLVLAGPRDGYLSRSSELDFYDAKGLAQELCRILTGAVPDVRIASDLAPSDLAPYLHPRSASALLIDDTVVGRLGEIHPDVVDAADLGGPAVIAEVHLDPLRAIQRGRRFAPLPRFPAVTRDLALLVDEAVRAADIERAARARAGALLEAIELFDLYRGEQIPQGKKSLALSFRYRSLERTLTDAEVDSTHAQVVDAMVRDLGGQAR